MRSYAVVENGQVVGTLCDISEDELDSWYEPVKNVVSVGGQPAGSSLWAEIAPPDGRAVKLIVVLP